MLDSDVTVKRHVTHHDANVLRRDVAVIVKVVHVEREVHLAVEVTDKDRCKVVQEARRGDMLALLPLLQELF